MNSSMNISGGSYGFIDRSKEDYDMVIQHIVSNIKMWQCYDYKISRDSTKNYKLKCC